MKICIIGAGPLGMSLAHFLSLKGHSLTIHESSATLGGLAKSFSLSNDTKLESYYHHIFESDKAFIQLATDLGVGSKIHFCKPTTGHYIHNKLYDISNPVQIYSNGLVSLYSFIRITIGYLFVKFSNSNFSSLLAKRGAKIIFGTESANKIWIPLLDRKFGKYSNLVPFSWLASRVRDRTPKLGYYEQGFHNFYKELESSLFESGVSIFKESKIKSVSIKDNKVCVDGKYYDYLVSTIGPVGDSHIQGIPAPSCQNISIGAICIIFEFSEHLPLPYWTNYCENDSDVLAIINHRELENSNRFKNIYPVYVAAYLDEDNPIFQLSNEELKIKFLSSISNILNVSSVNLSQKLISTHFSKSKYAQPIINPSKDLPPIGIRMDKFMSISMHSIYPNDRGQNYAIEYAYTASQQIDYSLSITNDSISEIYRILISNLPCDPIHVFPVHKIKRFLTLSSKNNWLHKIYDKNDNHIIAFSIAIPLRDVILFCRCIFSIFLDLPYRGKRNLFSIKRRLSGVSILIYICVDKDYQCKGLGRQLIAKIGTKTRSLLYITKQATQREFYSKFQACSYKSLLGRSIGCLTFN